VGVIEWRLGADAHEFLRADLDLGKAHVILEMRGG
jgi:hypothetical protein